MATATPSPKSAPRRPSDYAVQDRATGTVVIRCRRQGRAPQARGQGPDHAAWSVGRANSANRARRPAGKPVTMSNLVLWAHAQKSRRYVRTGVDSQAGPAARRNGRSGCRLLAVRAVLSGSTVYRIVGDIVPRAGHPAAVRREPGSGRAGQTGASARQPGALSAARPPSASDRRGRAARTSAALGRPSEPPRHPRPPRGPAGPHGWRRCQWWSR